MFKKRKAKEAAATKSPSLAAASSSSLSAQRQQQLDDFLSSSSPPNSRPPLSPLQVDFDFDLPSPAFGSDPIRPSTSDGTGARKTSLSNLPPILPPILRVSSQTEPSAMDGNQEEIDRDEILAKAQARFEQIRINGSDGRSGPAKSGSLLDNDIDAPLLSKPMIRNQDVRPSTAGEPSAIKMESSLFPTKAPLPTLSRPDADTPMSRAFIDARDKPYSSPPTRPQLQSANSSPDLRTTSRPKTATGTPTRNPLTTLTGNSMPRPVPQQSFSTGNMATLARPPSNAPTNYSGTTARSTFSSKSTATGSDILTKTIGTPYGETSSSFPLPQHVATRPKTAGTMATVRGVEVPTHHTSAVKPQPQAPAKGEKRKTKLLNPMNLLARKRTGQDDEAMTLDRAAQARQKDVAAAGVSRLPEDFDPRIRGKVVHDFSAPRSSRQFSYNDAVGPWSQRTSGDRGVLQGSNSAPFIPNFDQGGVEQKARIVSDGSPRRSTHMPMFKEHLEASDGSLQNDAAAVQAERLENKAFLNRVSHVSQESGVLPPFARRSQQVDTASASASASSPSDDAQREGDPRASTSSSGVSPITQRGSVLPSALDTRQSISPVSPATPDKLRPFSRLISRPVSEVSRLGSSDGKNNQRMSEVSRLDSADGVRPASTMSAVSDMTTGQGSSDVTTRFVSTQPKMEPIVEQLTPKLGDSFAPWPETQSLPPPVTPRRENDSSIVPTPETAALKASGVSKSPPRLAQKRDDAVGHAKRMSSGTAPKHHVSNASRFSFQFGGSALEEQILEEKGRRLTLDTSGGAVVPSQDLDDEDYFDEDAMDDLDEMELEDQQHDDLITGGMNTTSLPTGLQPESAYMPTFLSMADARQKLQFDSDGESDVASGEETPYWKHDAFGSYAHTRDHSISEDPATHNVHQRKKSDEAAKLTLNTNVGPNGSAFVQDVFAGDSNARSGFYMQPAAAGYSPTSTRAGAAQPPPLPHRNSGNSELNRVASGLQVAPQPPGSGSTHRATVSNSTMASLDEIADRSLSETGVQSTPSTETTGLGLTGFSGFKFVDSPDASRPQSGESQKQRYLSRPVGADRSRGDSETLPQAATFGLATSSTDRQVSPMQDRYMDDQYDLDDMYFDDGGFEPDVNNRTHVGEAVDEDVFDDPNFLKKPNGAVQPIIPNGAPSLEFMGVGGDGPYPSFTLPKSKKVRERDSQLLLEDLPLYEQPFDPKWIPRRNPSEDAKRLGLSKKAPPLPLHGMSADAAARVQANLSAYHAALADAANRAAADGRFSRLPSTSTTRSRGAVPTDEDADVEDSSQDDVSNYSLLENDDATSTIKGNSALNSHDPKSVPDPNLPMAPIYNPSQMNFDFGFDSAPPDDSVLDSDFEDLMGDDDIVAAANAEALASDEDGFYGQEFGFYAKARPNSSEVEAINGGFFGLDGDDGLARQKSLKEPNLTPITERSEFSTRNSFIGLGMGGHGPASAGPFSPYQRLPVSPWMENEVTTFDQLRKLKASAFGGSNISLHSDSSGGLQMNSGSAPVSARSSAAAQGYFGPLGGGTPMTYGYSTESSSSSNPSSAHPQQVLQVQDSPHSAASSSYLPLTMDPEATPKRPSTAVDTPMTVRRISDKPNRGHSRTSSGADSVTYVREQDPEGNGPPRWVLEKRRTSEQGQLELVAREVVQDGWI